MKNYDLYGIGAALVDIELEVDDAFLDLHNIEKGEMTLVEPKNQAQVLNSINSNQIKTKQASGGSAANTIFAAANFGSSCYHSCKTNNDNAGKFFVNDMQRAGVDCTPNLIDQKLPTGTCLVMITPDAERTMNTYLAISETISENELNEEAIKHSKYYYMEGYLSTSDSSRHAAIKGREVAEQNNCKTVLTFSDPAMVKFFKDQLAEMLGGGVDLLFCNEEEALLWTDTDSLQEALAKLKEVCKSYAVTLGAKGAVVYDGEHTHQIAAQKVKAVDTNGAGDMFAGAFLHAINRGCDFQQAGNLASAAAAKVVSDFGPRLAINDHKALLSILN
jgi:fructokinase